MLLPTVQCPCPLQSALLQAVTFLSPGCHGVQTGGTHQHELRNRVLTNTHQNYTHDISNQQHELTVAKLAQASCTSLKERGALHSACPYDSVLRDILGIRFLGFCLGPLLKTRINGKSLLMSEKIAPSISQCLLNSTDFLGIDVRLLNP